MPSGQREGLQNVPAFKFFEIRRWCGFQRIALRVRVILVDPQDRLMGANQRPLDDIFQFPDIARPGVAYQPLERFLVNISARPIELYAIPRLGHEQEHLEVLVALVWTGATAMWSPSRGDIFNGIALSARAFDSFFQGTLH